MWFDELQMKVGQSIRQEIESGIAGCRFGVVIVSPHFFAKQWTQAELDALFGKKWIGVKILYFRSGITSPRTRSVSTPRFSREFLH